MLSLRWRLALLASPLVIYLVLFLAPLSFMVTESFRTYVPGSIGSTRDAPFTLENFAILIDPAYVFYFADTFRLAFIAAALALGLGYPLAHHIARRPAGFVRKSIVSTLVLLMFMSALVKVYALTVTLGPVGIGRPLAGFLDTGMNSRMMGELFVVIGLFSFLYPIACLMLVATIQNVNPRYLEAAVALGANRITGHIRVVLPLCLEGLVSTFLVVYTLGISAFVIPMILGRGQVDFITNLIFTRFSEIANYPSGSALSVLMLIVSLTLVFLISGLLSRLVTRRMKPGGGA